MNQKNSRSGFKNIDPNWRKGKRKCKYCNKFKEEFVICNTCYGNFIVHESQHYLDGDKRITLDTIKFSLEDIEKKLNKITGLLENAS